MKALRALTLAITLAGSEVGRADSYTVSVPPGNSAVGINLDSGSNTLSFLITNPPSFANVFRWNGTGFDIATYTFGGWDNDYTFAVGDGFVFFNTAGIPIDLTFTGSRLVPQPRPRLPDGKYYLLACRTPDPCVFDDMMGFPPRSGDQVQFFDRATGSFTNAQLRRTFLGPSGWDVTPVIGIGEAVMVYLALPDTSPPTVLNAIGTFRLDVVRLTFSEPVTGGTATNPANYQISGGIVVSGAILAQNGTNVFLLTSPQVAGSNYVVTFNNVADLSGNRIAPGTQISFTAPFPQPVILQPPQSQSVGVGSNATFSVVAGGLEPLSYQWQTNGVALPGATGPMLTIKGVTAAMDGVQLSVRVVNSAGATNSSAAILTVLTPPSIVVQPVSQTVSLGTDVTLMVQATGPGPLRYQWRLNGANLPGATNATLTVSNVQLANLGAYFCTVANPFGATHSQIARLGTSLTALSVSDNFGDARLPMTSFSFAGRGNNAAATREPGEPLHAHRRGRHSVWLTWMTPVGGIATLTTAGSAFDTLLAVYTGPSLANLAEVAADDDTANFYASSVMFNARAGEVYQIAVDGLGEAAGEFVLVGSLELTLEVVPQIFSQPTNLTVEPGATAVFGVAAGGTNLNYQWIFKGALLTGETNATLVRTNVQPADVGIYLVVVRSGTRLLRSQVVQLEISPLLNRTGVLPASEDKFVEVFVPAGPAPQALSVGPRTRSPHGAPARGFSGTQIFSTYGAAKEAGEPNHCDVAGGASQWFAYIAETNGTLYVKTDGSDYDTVLAVYTGPGDSFDTLVPVACDNNPGVNGMDRVNFAATQDEVYWIAVDGVGGVSGNVQLTYTLALPLSMTAPVLDNGTNIGFQVSATPSLPFSIQVSTNLMTWTTLMTTNTLSGLYDYTNSGPAVVSGRFFRVTMLP